jgi:KaiC/GvpD/RAD55 family RecA-like ATPase
MRITSKKKKNKILDKLTKNTIITIVGPRKDLSLELLKQEVKNGKNCVFVSTDTDIKIIENELRKTLTNNIENRTRFIGCSGGKQSFNAYRSDLRDLSHLNVVLAQSLADLMSPESTVCILDSLSDIERNNTPDDFSKFIEILKDIVKKYNTTAVLFSDKENERIKNLVDNIELIK